MSAPQSVTVSRITNGWLLSYYAKDGHELREYKFADASLLCTMTRIARAYGEEAPPATPPSKVVSHSTAAAILRAQAMEEDDAVGDPVVPGCATGACGVD